MTYRIAREGQIYGPYSLLEVERHIASGHIIAGDLAQAAESSEWRTVEDLFPTSAPQDAPPHPGGLPRLYPDPPDLKWWIALIIAIVTGTCFFPVWDVVLSLWLRRVDRSSLAFWLYLTALVLFLITLPDTFHTIQYTFGEGARVDAPFAAFLALTGLFLRLIARFVFRSELLKHFNRDEPIGLELNWFLTLLFGGLYFQYHFNRINELKRSLRVSVPSF